MHLHAVQRPKETLESPFQMLLEVLLTTSCYFALVAAGIDYTQPVFGPCTDVGVPASTCKVVYAEDIAEDDGALDNDPRAPGHGTNVACIVACKCMPAFVLTHTLHPGLQAAHSWPRMLRHA